MRIYLADLVYDTTKTSHVVPLNVGYVAAKLAQDLGPKVDIRLFKFPTELEAAIRQAPPDLLGLSNYSWNTRLNEVFLRMFKRLNPAGVTVMGGPHLRVAAADIAAFLREHPELDYYVPGEGVLAVSRLAQALLDGESEPAPTGCATLRGGNFRYVAEPFSAADRRMDLPSPYLTGWLDPFLKNPEMMPLFESNRGCPFNCKYCSWGGSELSRVKARDFETVLAEIDYVAEHSAGQMNWLFCDANFGILPRDVEIARKIRQVMDRKGFPVCVTLWHSKNTSKRNIEIAEVLGSTSMPLVAIQSADPQVLENVGRKNIRMDKILEQVRYYHHKGLEVMTDILIGLPGETRQSHLASLTASFDMGFDYVEAINIRMLPGSAMEMPAFRAEHGIQTKFRPIFGACGVYDGQRCFEFEEGIRASSAMSETELNAFKVHHWLIYCGWNSGLFRAVLKFGQSLGINPMAVIEELGNTSHPDLRALFDQLLAESLEEWFPDKDEFLAHYSSPENFDSLRGFYKLTSKYIAMLAMHPAMHDALLTELRRILTARIPAASGGGALSTSLATEILEHTERRWCRDLLADSREELHRYSGAAAAIIFDRPELASEETVQVRIFRTEEIARFCRFHLAPRGVPDLSLGNLVYFLQAGGFHMLLFQAEVVRTPSPSGSPPLVDGGEVFSGAG